MKDLDKNTILVVDDAPLNLKIITAFLKRAGFSIRIAMDGKQAIDFAEQFIPDIILLDVIMPGINGFEICRCLKEMETTQDVPVIFMTALTDEDDKIKGFEAGGVDFITKPLQFEEVLARVNTYLTIRTQQKELERQKKELIRLNSVIAEQAREIELISKTNLLTSLPNC